MSVINSEKIVEVLFENSEDIPSYVYVHIMNLMKQYHETKDNEEEIKEYILKLDTPLKNKIQKYIREPCCVINITCENPCDESCRSTAGWICVVLCFVLGFGVIAYCVATSKRESSNSLIKSLTNTTNN